MSVERDFRFGPKGSRHRSPLPNIFSVDASSGQLKRDASGKETSPGTAGDSMCLCNRNSRPIGSVDDMSQLENCNSSANKRSRSGSRNRRHHKGSRSGRSGHHNRKRHAAATSSGDSLHSQGAADGWGAESGPELGGTTEDVSNLEKSYADRMIKFGSMPSYREDKIKREKNRESPVVTTSGTSPLQSKHLIDLSSGPPKSYVHIPNSSSPHNGSLTAATVPWTPGGMFGPAPVFANAGMLYNEASPMIMVTPHHSGSNSISPVPLLMPLSSQLPPVSFSELFVGQAAPTNTFVEPTHKKLMTSSAISGEESEVTFICRFF